MNSPSQDVEVIPQLTYPPDSSQHPSTSIGRARRDTSLSVGQIFESLPLTREHLKCCFALFFVFVMEAWEMMIIVYTSPLIAREFKLSSVAVGNLMGAMFVGMGIGSVIWGPISDRIGRKKTIIWHFIFGKRIFAGLFDSVRATVDVRGGGSWRVRRGVSLLY
jgi:putative MFS transporter